MQVQRGRDTRRASDARSHTHAGEHPAKAKRIKLYGIFERQKCTDDVR